VAEAALEAAGEIELVAELQLRGDLLDRETPLMQQGGGAVDAGVEVEAAGGKADGGAKFLAEGLVGEAKLFGDGVGREAGPAVGDHQLAGGVEPVLARRGRVVGRLAVG